MALVYQQKQSRKTVGVYRVDLHHVFLQSWPVFEAVLAQRTDKVLAGLLFNFHFFVRVLRMRYLQVLFQLFFRGRLVRAQGTHHLLRFVLWILVWVMVVVWLLFYFAVALTTFLSFCNKNLGSFGEFL